MWSQIEDKLARGERLSTAEGIHLMTDAPLLEMGALANEVRARKTDAKFVTYVVDTNPNYTNWCTVAAWSHGRRSLAAGFALVSVASMSAAERFPICAFTMASGIPRPSR